jgi:hypothetical protein
MCNQFELMSLFISPLTAAHDLRRSARCVVLRKLLHDTF